MKSVPLLELCTAFNLGTPLTEPKQISGGTLNLLWHIETTKGEYALKRLHQANMQRIGKQYCLVHHAQQLVHAADKVHVKTHFAEQHADGFVLMLDAPWAVYDWVPGECVTQDTINATHATQMGELLAKLHQMELDLPELTPPNWHALHEEEWHDYLRQASNDQHTWAPLVEQHLAQLSDWSAQARAAKLAHTKISHRDLNIFNIIWTPEGDPTVIDWELAGLIHPDLDLLITAINWSYRDHKIDRALFDAVVMAFNPGDHWQPKALLGAYYGYYLDWMIFNMRRSLAEPEQKQLATSEIEFVIDVLTDISTEF